MSGFERTGWRDERLSLKHRQWGFDCPAADVDLLLVEYHIGVPVGLVEYKHFKARIPDFQHPTMRAFTLLADKYSDGPLPFIVAVYWPDIWAFRIIPVNECAKQHFYENEKLSEAEFVKRLYRMRSLVLTEHLMKSLNTTLPPDEWRVSA
jgi:hypothetical protein